MTVKQTKKRKLRNNEYYDMQEMLDDLYNKSRNKPNFKFYKLMELITDEKNIELAYRNLKKNVGSKTSGTNGKTIEYFKSMNNTQVVDYVRKRLINYSPQEVRRVEIPKHNGKTRPLGIPTIGDRLIQQCILQILEPICEAKFHPHNYGFRANRSTSHAIARCYHLASVNKLHYVVDIDIKGFFDNVNHSKLLKQIWTLGIQDKRLISIIGKILKAPIENEGVPNKGTPQGGILSPLLSNIVLNELDWWISNQWETFETKHCYDKIRKTTVGNEYIDRSHKYRALRKTNLKEIYIVRYADDFKIFCKNHTTAAKIYNATQKWLKERLELKISEEKSRIVNLKNNYSEYLGFKIKVTPKNGKYSIKSHISNKAKENISAKLKRQVEVIKRETTVKNVNRYNAMVLGMHNYYNIATHVNIDFSNISYKLNKFLYNRTQNIRSKTGTKSLTFSKYYGKYNFKTVYIAKTALYPINGITLSNPVRFNQNISNFTKEGREGIHKNQKAVSTSILRYIMENPIKDRSVEYNDNRISLYVGQAGMCPISKKVLQIGEMECHHKIPMSNGGTDEYSNLIIVNVIVHKLIHAVEDKIIDKYLKKLKLDESSIKKLNKLRVLAGNLAI